MDKVDYINDLLSKLQTRMLPHFDETPYNIEQQKSFLSLCINYKNKNDEDFHKFGFWLSECVDFALNNYGFARLFLQKDRVEQGKKVEFSICGSRCVYIKSDNSIEDFQVKSYKELIYPAEFYITCIMLIDAIDINSLSSEKLFYKYFVELLSNTLKVENKLSLSLFRSASLFQMCDITFQEFTHSTFTGMMNRLVNKGKTGAFLVVGKNIWDSICRPNNEEYLNVADITGDDIFNGKLGYYDGIPIMSDLHLLPYLRTVRPDECFLLANRVGDVTIRKLMDARSIDSYNLGRPSFGYFFECIESMGVTGCQAVIRAVRK